MTKWEIGQDLIKISDVIHDIETDFRMHGHIKLANQLRLISAQVGELFNQNNDHAFGIPDSDMIAPKKTK